MKSSAPTAPTGSDDRTGLELVNSSPFAVALVPGRIQFPQHSMTLVVKGTFDLVRNMPAVLAEDQLPPTGDASTSTDDLTSYRYPNDFAFFKPNADLLLVGHCYAPDNRSVNKCRVEFSAGAHKHSFTVYGDRDLNGGDFQSPKPFNKMALDFSHSHGGPNFPANPIGKGDRTSNSVTLPNLSYGGDDREPAGFGPIPSCWEPRSKLRGTFDDSWQRQRWPWLPADFDYRYFNEAPRRSQLDGYLRGDEPIRLTNLHPQHGDFLARLPGLRVRSFLNEAGDPLAHDMRRPAGFREVDMNLDTLWVDPDQGSLVLVWRGVAPVRDQRWPGISHLFVMTERVAEPATSSDECWRRLQDAIRVEARSNEQGESNRDEPAAKVESLVAPGIDRSSLCGADLRNHDLSGMDFSGADLNGANLVGVNLQGAKLTNVDLRYANLAHANLAMANLHGARLERADLTAAVLENAELTRARLEDADFSDASLVGAALHSADGAGAVFRRSDLTDAVATGARFSGADFGGACLDFADFEGANLEEAHFESARGNKTGFQRALMAGVRAGRGARFNRASFREVSADGSTWAGATLEAADFTAASLNAADFDTAVLANAVLHRAICKLARFEHANLGKAKLTQANLFEASFESADLTEADFRKSNLYGAEFHDATLSQIRLEGTLLGMTKLAGGHHVA